MKRFMFPALLAAVMMLAGGCRSMGVEPWQRDILSKESMTIGGGEGIRAGYEKKIYFSREASSGGSGFAGGGCGCN